MHRHNLTVNKIAHQAGLQSDDVLLMLLDAGISVEKGNDVIPKRQYELACKIVGLNQKSISKKTQAEVSFLSEKWSLPEEEIRNLLFSAGLITKKRLKRIPVALIKKADEVLLKPRGGEKRPLETEKKVIVQKAKKPKKVPDKRWFIVGLPEEVTYLTAKDVEDIHYQLVDDFRSSKDPIDPPGIKSRALLESALFRPKTSLGAEIKYPTIAMAGAALLHSIIMNHPFHNGNKRTALVSLLVFLDKNGWIMNEDQDRLYDFLLKLAAHDFVNEDTKISLHDADDEALFIAQWLRNRIRRVRRGELPLQFRQLKDILLELGCEFRQSGRKDTLLKITCGKLQTVISHKGDGKEVAAQQVHQIRKNLHLDEEHGYDSDIFYNKSPRICDFIVKYRKVLNKLAKV